MEQTRPTKNDSHSPGNPNTESRTILQGSTLPSNYAPKSEAAGRCARPPNVDNRNEDDNPSPNLFQLRRTSVGTTMQSRRSAQRYSISAAPGYSPTTLANCIAKLLRAKHPPKREAQAQSQKAGTARALWRRKRNLALTKTCVLNSRPVSAEKDVGSRQSFENKKNLAIKVFQALGIWPNPRANHPYSKGWSTRRKQPSDNK